VYKHFLPLCELQQSHEERRQFCFTVHDVCRRTVERVEGDGFWQGLAVPSSDMAAERRLAHPGYERCTPAKLDSELVVGGLQSLLASPVLGLGVGRVVDAFTPVV
jgi:hypothetical protein